MLSIHELVTRSVPKVIIWRSFSMGARLAFLQFDGSKAGLSMDLPVLVHSHTKTSLNFFQDREDIRQLFYFK